MLRLQRRYVFVGLAIVLALTLFVTLETQSGYNLEKSLQTVSKAAPEHVSSPIVALDPNIVLDSEGLKTPVPKTTTKEKAKEEEHFVEPCSVIRNTPYQYIDLRKLSAMGNEGKARPFPAKGYDSGLNYTLGICLSPFKLKHSHEVMDITNSSEVGAFYIDPESGKYVSMGKYLTKPVFRGKKLTLTYNGGSICPGLIDTKTKQPIRKSTVMTFTCDRDMLAKAQISYVGSLNDCSYFFEVRSQFACPTATKGSNLLVIWIFLFILMAALAVYSSGGLLYKYMKKQKQHEKYNTVTEDLEMTKN